ncbi:hypothetical protein Amsp01_046300 [Amycolatopsis sp. NBRC 101858]|uniref:hypothetical protein n=1 Tax=Amycolatopsis sp. NBRC 101858 TaxID=3032200 RepID=UPI0024A253F3|nr:hypothetical protein [Amycolatopsis sp. NBRC 101858]GLY38606.1 hypothetical protein Amsp01_046300 [Amycolatopsis sp. NBRC 101858]
MNEFETALTSAFGTGPAGVPGLTVVPLDGRAAAGTQLLCVGDGSVSPCVTDGPERGTTAG